MALQVVHVDEGDAQCAGQSLGEAHAHKERAHEARAAGEGHCRELFFLYAGALDGLVYHRHHILLVRTRGQLGHHTAVGAVHILRGGHVAQQHAVAQHGGRCVVAAAFYAEYVYVVHNVSSFVNG